MVAPVSTEPGVAFTFSIATVGFPAEIVPSRDAKMKIAGLPASTSKSELPLKTRPVGPPTPPAGHGESSPPKVAVLLVHCPLFLLHYKGWQHRRPGPQPTMHQCCCERYPWIKQVRIDEFCALSAGIGDLIGLLILLSKRRERRESCAGHNEGKASAPQKEPDEKTAFCHRYFILSCVNCNFFRVTGALASRRPLRSR